MTLSSPVDRTCRALALPRPGRVRRALTRVLGGGLVALAVVSLAGCNSSATDPGALPATQPGSAPTVASTVAVADLPATDVPANDLPTDDLFTDETAVDMIVADDIVVADPVVDGPVSTEVATATAVPTDPEPEPSSSAAPDATVPPPSMPTAAPTSDAFSLPAPPTIPKTFDPAPLAVGETGSVDGVSFAVPRGWAQFRNPAEVAAATTLTPALNAVFSVGLESDPNRVYLMPLDQVGSATPTWASVIVTTPSELSSAEVSTRLEQFAAQSEGLRVAARAGRDWLDRRGTALLFRGEGQRRRLAITARLPDRRSVTVQTEGYGEDLPAVHALLVLSVVPAPSPGPPPTTGP